MDGLTSTLMFSIKDLCGWYGVGYQKMREELIEVGVIPNTDKGKGNRKRLSLLQLSPVFKKFGIPKDLKLKLPIVF